jgi:hypothetical protein
MWAKEGRLRNLGSVPGKIKRYYLLQNVKSERGTHPPSYSMDMEALSPENRGLVLKLITAHHLVPRPRNCIVVRPLQLSAFVLCTGKS